MLLSQHSQTLWFRKSPILVSLTVTLFPGLLLADTTNHRQEVFPDRRQHRATRGH